MTNLAHIAETALLLLVAYLLGCVVGYGVRRVLHAARGTRQIAPVAVLVPEPIAQVQAAPKRVRTPAARLAAAASDEPLPVLVKPAPKPRKPTPRAKVLDPKPAALSAPRGGQADNLKQIKGIGPKIEASLNAMGIYHLDQVAAWSKANVDWVDAQLAFKGRIRREQWVEQATDLSKVKA